MAEKPSSSFLRTAILLLLAAGWVLVLAACSPSGGTETPSPVPPTAPTASPSAANDTSVILSPFSVATLTFTPTATATATSTATFTRTPTRTVTPTPGPTTTLTTGPTRTPTRTPAGTLTPTPLVLDTGIFQPVFSFKNFPPGLIQAVYPLSGSRAIISGTYGLVSVDLLTQQISQLRTSDRLLGVDAAGTAWLTPANGSQIYAWDGQDSTAYKFSQGWILNASFFDAPLGGSRLVDGKPGQVWLTTASDVRVFDGKRWRIFTESESGIRYTRQAYVHTAIALAVNPNTGEAMAGTCDWRGSSMLDGGGIRRYDGAHWVDAGFPQENPCVNWLKAGSNGTIYASIGGSIWSYTNDQGWGELPLPRLSSFQQYGSVEDMPLGTDQMPWPLVRILDRDGQLVERIRFRMINSEWQPVRYLDQISPQSLLFLPGGRVWALEQSAAYALLGSDEWQLQASFEFRAGASDPEGGIWLVSDVDQNNPLLWRGLP